MKKIRILVNNISAIADLGESKTSEAIWDELPIECRVNTWGEEIYFEIPVTSQLDSTAKEVVEKGDLGYWPTGKAFCIFFGPTPASRGDEIRPASAVNIVGKVSGNTEVLKSVQDGAAIRVERME
ncbi:MAG: cyclophilin-like fold protein [Candidatus Scalinduaceae bacterium]